MKKVILILAACVALPLSSARAEDTGDILVPNRLSGAKVGEWASYRLPSGYIQKLTVTNRDGDGPEAIVTVLAENMYDGEIVTAHEITHEAGEVLTAPRIRDGDNASISVRRDQTTLGNKPYAVTIVHIERTGEDEDDYRSTEWWSSPEIPVFGIVKRVEEGEVQWEIEAWGEAE